MRKITCLISVLLGAVILIALLSENNERSRQENRLQKIPEWGKILKRKSTPYRKAQNATTFSVNALIIGKLLDEDGSPVEGVSVNLSLAATDLKYVCPLFNVKWKRGMTYMELDSILELWPPEKRLTGEQKAEIVDAFLEENRYQKDISLISRSDCSLEGKFRIVPGHYFLECCPGGYEALKTRIKYLSPDVFPDSGLAKIELETIELKILKTTSLTVLALGPDNAPVKNATVTLAFVEDEVDGSPNFNFCFRGQRETNSQGLARFEDIEPGHNWAVESLAENNQVSTVYGVEKNIAVNEYEDNRVTIYMDYSASASFKVVYRDHTEQNPKPAKNLPVQILRIIDGSTETERHGRTDSEGNVKFWGLCDGDKYFIGPIGTDTDYVTQEMDDGTKQRYYGAKIHFHHTNFNASQDYFVRLGSHGGRVEGNVYISRLVNGVLTPEVNEDGSFKVKDKLKITAITFPHRRKMVLETDENGHFCFEGLGTEGTLYVCPQDLLEYEEMGDIKRRKSESETVDDIVIHLVKCPEKGEIVLILKPSNDHLVSVVMSKDGEEFMKEEFIPLEGTRSYPNLDKGEYHMEIKILEFAYGNVIGKVIHCESPITVFIEGGNREKIRINY